MRADEISLREARNASLLFLPSPYVRISEENGLYPQWFPDDANYLNMALLIHGRADLVEHHIKNYAFSIERYGFVPNANDINCLTRSSAHFLPVTALKLYEKTGDRQLLERVYAAVTREYRDYWLASHHSTPTGLSTFRDLGDTQLSPELAAEAESAMDFTPIWGADVRECVPINLNCILVVFARCLSKMAAVLGFPRDVSSYEEEARTRSEAISRYCWDTQFGLFREYNHKTRSQLETLSDGSFWTLWSGVASREQAAQIVRHLHLFEKPFGISVTPRAYRDPHRADAYDLRQKGRIAGRIQDVIAPDSPAPYHGGRNPLMWMYPAGWGSLQIVACAGLDAFGYKSEARRAAGRFLSAILNQYARTGKLWEKYNLEDGGLVLPNARYGNIPYYSFTGAAAVMLGNYIFRDGSVFDYARV
jgi:alpha,alpha-trehalase